MAESKMAGRKKKSVLRREFLISGGAAIAAGALGARSSGALAAAPAEAATPAATPSYAASAGYIVYDSRLCLGCQGCMFACSTAHEGEANPSLSRIQIIRDAPSFTKYPYDIVMSVCRQCVTPLCVQNCPTDACHVDAANGNVRRIDQAKCIGCKQCLNFCPQRPRRTIWNPANKKSAKCDLCIDAPYWSHQGGPNGRQACVESCPAKALKLVKEPPPQMDIAGYDVNLAPPPAPKVFPPKPAAKQE